ncbi:hypothetical protein [Maribellus mangrovi]|uniref:hypothetical protein n=1 Tax=Maribellus mangrovi TaxID=3133146 RepID=UPI0030EF83D4
MRTFIYLSLALFLFAESLFAQDKHVDKYFKINPCEIKQEDSKIQEYDVNLKWKNIDPISGSKITCSAIKAKYSCGLDSGLVKWSDVFLFNINNFKQKLENGNRLEAFDDFEYKPNFFSFASEKYYTDIPPNLKEIASWFILDAIQMHGINEIFFDSLTFCTPFYPETLDTFSLKVENGITFKSQYAKFVWSGITKMNGEICAIINYESFFNPVSMDVPGYAFQGRSLYWGEIWISLVDKQFEYAKMVEDIIIKLKSPQFTDGKLINMQREIVFEKEN